MRILANRHLSISFRLFPTRRHQSDIFLSSWGFFSQMTVLEDIKQALKSLSIHVLAIPTTFYLQSPSSTLPEAQERPALPEDFFKAIE
jgi:hypothetical protein